MPSVHSYVVRYDSGFAPNPFYGICTLATCKPEIRRTADIGDWIVGSGSDARGIRLGGRLVYAMEVSEALTFEEYDADLRFEKKKPFRFGSRKQSSGDNIYHRNPADGTWSQRNSFHTNSNGQPNPKHIRRDTGVNRVLIGEHFVYFGGEGPQIPDELSDEYGRPLAKRGIGRSRFDEPILFERVTQWISDLGVSGYQGRPQEWISLHG